jgi:hypothetical protein
MIRPVDLRIPLGIMIRMIRNLQPRDLSEGFDSVKVVDADVTG